MNDTTYGAPSGLRLLRELASFPRLRFLASFGSPVPLGKCGNGQHVIVIPGFMASDLTTRRLRRSLQYAGYIVHGWGLGRNRGVRPDMLHKIDARIDAIDPSEPVIFIGWSLGGVIAREYAKFAPHRVNQVITLGSPFSGDIRANNAWRIYEIIAGHKIDNLPIEVNLPDKPPVPTIAFWSDRDGVVSAQSACGLQGEADRQIQVACLHMGFISNPAVIKNIAVIIA
jgi:pimeloyl-ACP methyl ester carboxylesterase